MPNPNKKKPTTPAAKKATSKVTKAAKAVKKTTPSRKPVAAKKPIAAKKSVALKKPTERGTRSTRTPNKKNTKPAAGARQRRAKQIETVRALTQPPPVDLVQVDVTHPLEPVAILPDTPQQELKKIMESAKRLGIEMDEDEALQWLTQMAIQDKNEITVDAKNLVYGAKIAIMDFSAQDLEYFRRIGKIVGLADKPGIIETALALSGSAAQSKIQKNPGDADFFQRVNIKAATREEAVKILADAMRAKGMENMRGVDFQLLSVKFGTHSDEAVYGGKPIKKRSPMTWQPRELEAGSFEIELADGTKKTIRWEDGAIEPGWTKLDWVVADTQRGQLSNASNLLDVTWEAPSGDITPLDGFVDPYFQEIYLDAGSVPIFSKLVQQVDEGALDKYVTDLEHEVYKYLIKHPNYGKVAKRTYNIFRLTNRYAEAAYIRELFDEPTTALYRVWSMFETLSGAATPDSRLDRVALLKQYDQLIEQVVMNTEGEKEIRVVRALMSARDESLGYKPFIESMDKHFEASREDVIGILNAYFHDLLYGYEPIAEFLEQIRTRSYE